MKLYITPLSPYARLARIVVLEKGLEGRVEVTAAQTRIADSPYYAINPSGRVPYLLRDDGVGMQGSAVICAYLDQLNGKPTFAPAAGEEAWELRRLEALARSLVDGLTVWGRELRHRPEEERSPRIIEHERQRSRRLTDQWEREVVNAQMCGGLNMAQRVLACGLQYGSYVLGLDWHGAYPNLARWLDEIAQRPSLAATAPSSGS